MFMPRAVLVTEHNRLHVSHPVCHVCFCKIRSNLINIVLSCVSVSETLSHSRTYIYTHTFIHISIFLQLVSNRFKFQVLIAAVICVRESIVVYGIWKRRSELQVAIIVTLDRSTRGQSQVFAQKVKFVIPMLAQ